MSELPGRSCPLRYRYGAQAIASAPTRQAETLYVIGGLYGNVHALKTIKTMIAAETISTSKMRVCFNGDFNWFNVSDQDFSEINEFVAQHDAILGNVEAELASDDLSAGCGCAYPEEVSDLVVERSNRIFERLHRTALRHDAIRSSFLSLPMFARYQIGRSYVGIVHGDAESLAGWQFDVAALNQVGASAKLHSFFEDAKVEVFASSHTCLPALKTLSDPKSSQPSSRAVINNGAAGMPNFTQTRYGVITRIGLQASTRDVLYSTQVGDLFVEALRVDFDYEAWSTHFLESWPKGSDAYESYFKRICEGPQFLVEEAVLPCV